MSTEKLSPMQWQILATMEARGPAAFTGERSRVDGFGVFDAKHGGVVIRAYQSPQWFLKQRGLIALLERAFPGTWYEITDKGRKALG